MEPSRIEGRAIEYNVVDHCNLRCARCDHASPTLGRRFADLAAFRHDLTALSAVLRVRELKFVGGEPLLHPELVAFIRTAREIGIAERLTLITNGVLLHRLDDAILPLIDKLWVSRYPGVEIRADLAALRRVADRHHVRLHIRWTPTFRHTLLDSRHTDAALVQRIYRRCDLAHRWSCHTVRDGYYYKCSPAPFLEPRLARQGTIVANRSRDGVRLHDNPHLRAELARYLADPQPLEACHYCLGSSGREFAHQQLARGSRGDSRGDSRGEGAPTVLPRPEGLLEERPVRLMRRAAARMALDVVTGLQSMRPTRP
jgi:hypothetical protein